MDVLPSLREMLADGWAAFPGWAALVAAIALVWLTRIRLDDRARTPVLALLLVCGLLYAWQLRWLADDAYIPFRYAYNWVHGQGIVWNPGERVEGYTSFLWVLMAATSLAVHLDPQKISVLLCLAAFAGAILVEVRIVRALGGHWLLAATLLAFGYTFASFGTAGLETMVAALLSLVALERAMAGRFGAAGLCGTLAIFGHPDHAIFYFGLGVAILLDAAARAGWRRYVIPFVALYIPYYLWRWHYYGDFFPNTYYAKSADRTYFSQGAIYLLTFVLLGGLWGLLPSTIVAAVRRPKLLLSRYVAIAVPIYLVYVAKIGGDFMFGRLFVVVLPPLVALAALESRTIFVALATAVLVHVPVFPPRKDRWHITEERTSYRMDSFNPVIIESDLPHYGEVLKQHFFDRGLHPTLEIYRIGMIGYFSHLPIIDGFGLTDRFVGHQDLQTRGRVGHEKAAPWDYVRAHADLSGGLPVYPFPYAGLTRMTVDGVELHLVHYDPKLIAALRTDPRAHYLEFPVYLDAYLAGLAQRPSEMIARDLEFFDEYYFSRNPDPARRERIAARLATTKKP